MIWRFLIFELVAVLMVVGVWFGAPVVGITSVLWRVLIILALLLPPLGLIFWTQLRGRKAAKGLEAAIREQGRAQQQSSRPDRQQEVEALRGIFDQAISALKKSKIGRGGSALYALPWYMIIGPPAVGKSTALLHSGLKFPFSTGDRKAVKGMGGTRNCDWWFSDQAILLDTAGRYASEDEDLEEWIGFLRLLRKYRRRRPLNGLLVAVSVPDLLNASPEEIEELAGKIRSRVDQVIQELDLALPVYVLFTKCDLISGFIQFFGDLTKTTRSQIFGFTVPLTDARTDVEQLFNQEFDLLTAKLRERSLARLASAKSQHRNEVFQFPLQFAAAREPLGTFISQLLMANPYVEMPRMRGVYFCSGTQEGRPVDRVMASMSRALGLRELAAQGFDQGSQKKSYFLRNVFTEVLFPDQHLAGSSALSRSRRQRLGLAAVVGSVLLSAGLLAPAAVSFSNNRQLVRETVEVAQGSRITTPEDPRRVMDGLRALDRLGRTMDSLDHYARSGVPWSLSLGYYQGDKLQRPVEQIYVKRMRQAFVIPAGSELEATLTDVATTTEVGAPATAAADFDLLKTYLMVTDPARLEVELAAAQLIAQWKKRLHPEVAQENQLLLSNARRYLRLLKSRRATWLERDKDLVRNARHALRGRDAEYRALIGNAEAQLRPFTLRDALRGRIQTALSSSVEIPGIYTRAGWTQYIQVRIARQMVSGGKIEPWVLGEEGNKDATERLRERYFEQYIIAWQRFLKGLALEPVSSAEDSLRLLERLTEPPALYQELFSAVAYNTELPTVDAGQLGGAAKLMGGRGAQALSRAKQLGLDKSLPRASMSRVERTFLPLKELVSSPAGSDGRPQISGLQQYQAQLETVRDELSKELKAAGAGGAAGGDGSGVDRAIEEAQRVTRGVLATLPGDLRRVVGPLLQTPLESAGSSARLAQANRASSSFQNDLCAFFNERLDGRYPFARTKTDSLVQDAAAFFSPKGTLWSYFNETFRAQIVRRGDVFQAAPGKRVPDGIVTFFNQAWRITRALFPMGSDTPGIRFQVRPHPAVVQGASSVSEIVLEVEGKQSTYRNGPSEQWSFEWSGQDKRSRLLVRGAGRMQEELSFHGDWSLMRLLERGKAQKRGSWTTVEWSLRGGAIRVSMDFRPERTYNPLFMPMQLSCR